MKEMHNQTNNLNPETSCLHSHMAAEVLNPDSSYPVILTVEHASPAVPDSIELGVDMNDANMDCFYDVGIPAVAKQLAQEMNATTILSKYSRLVVDLNRMTDESGIVADEFCGLKVPGNRNLSENEKQFRIDHFYRPYHATIAAHIERLQEMGITPALLSLHSFPRHEHGHDEPFSCDYGCLYSKDDRMSRIFIDHMHENYPEVRVGENEPYDMKVFQTGTAFIHGEQKKLPYTLIEISIDRLQSEADISYWSKITQECLQKTISML